VIGKISVVAGNQFGINKLLCLQRLAVCRQDVLDLLSSTLPSGLFLHPQSMCQWNQQVTRVFCRDSKKLVVARFIV
jgi:hypothetical protein